MNWFFSLFTDPGGRPDVPTQQSTSPTRPAAGKRVNRADVVLLDGLGLEPAGPLVGRVVVLAIAQEENEAGWTRAQQEALRQQQDALGPRQTFRKKIERARGQALKRLHEQAARHGLAGVVQIRLHARVLAEHEGQALLELSASGEGLRRTGGPADAPIFSATFGAGDLVALADRGFWPLAALSTSVTARFLQTVPGEYGSAAWRESAEMAALHRAAVSVRSRAVHGLQTQARTLRAAGLLDVRLERHHHDWLAPSTEYLATGTAVRRAEPPSRGHSSTVLMLPLER